MGVQIDFDFDYNTETMGSARIHKKRLAHVLMALAPLAILWPMALVTPDRWSTAAAAAVGARYEKIRIEYPPATCSTTRLLGLCRLESLSTHGSAFIKNAERLLVSLDPVLDLI